MSAKRGAIIALHRAGKSDSFISKTLSIARSTVWKAVKRFDERGDLTDRPRSGRPRSKRTKQLIKCTREKIRRSPRRSMRLLAKTADVSPRTMRRVVHDDLKMSSFTLQKRQTLSAAVKQKRLERSKALLRELKSGTAGEIVWSDEKIFTVEMAHNRRNDRIIGRSAKDIPYDQKTVHRTIQPASVMVWAAVSKTWRSPLIFVEQGAKIDAKCYVENILTPMLESAKAHFSEDTLWTFQQDGATSHTANVSQNWCHDHLPRFWSKEMWPPCSPDLNPMDFSVWSILEAKACGKFHRSVDDLKRSLQRSWDEIPQEQLRAAVEAVRKRFEAVIKCKGGHFE